MNVTNIHQRDLDATPEQVGTLIDSLASPDDRLWPHGMWPPMKFDRPLSVRAAGGHGPVRYYVESYIPGRSVRFRFTGPAGFNGYHGYDLLGSELQPVVLRHTIKMATSGLALLTWPLVYRPLHDALLEDSLAIARHSLGQQAQVKPWSLWVKTLRWVVSGGKAPGQTGPAMKRKRQ